jgi:hypothetical protein
MLEIEKIGAKLARQCNSIDERKNSVEGKREGMRQ